MGRMAVNHIIPAALKYQNALLKNVSLMKELDPGHYRELAAFPLELIGRISALTNEIREKVDAMVEARKKANVLENEYEKARAYHDIAESLSAIRKPIDKLEEIVDDTLWPMPKYRELLFIN